MEGTLKPIVQADSSSGELDVQKKRLRENCREFESVMVSYMMKTMQDTVMRAEKPDSAREMYEDMLSQQISKQVSKTETLGLGEMLYSKLEPLLEKSKQSVADQSGPANTAPPEQTAELNRKLSDLSALSQIGENLSLKNRKPFAD